MLQNIRKFAWLIPAAVAVLSLVVGTVVAHEGRPVGDYRFIVGWLEEPAYEGTHNSVSVRVNKIVEPESASALGEQQEDHGEPGHHGEQTEPTPSTPSEQGESIESEGHHGAEGEDSDEGEGHRGTEDEDSDSGDHHGSEDEDSDSGDHHGSEDEDSESVGSDSDHSGSTEGDGMTSMTHGESGHHSSTIEAVTAMSVALNVTADQISGANVQILTEGFTLAPENVNGAHVEGEGHAHIYIDGVKISRVYSPWHHLGSLTPGEHEIRVTLNANSHQEYTIGGTKVEVVAQYSYQEPHGHGHAPETQEAENQMAVSIKLEPDPLGGANLFVETDGFAFTPQHAGSQHVPGEGHAQVSVNEVETGRLYGRALQLGNLEAGENEVTVTLNTNDFSDYTWDGEKVQATATIDIPEAASADGGTGHHGDADEPFSSLIIPQGAAKPLASIAGQDEGVAVPVEGLEGSLQVEVTHVATGASRILDLQVAWGDPGHYVAGLIPTASGVYEFRVFGTSEGTPVDETFVSGGGGGDFDDIQSSTAIQFPEQLPEMREVVSAVQGARDIAQQAQDAALSAQAGGTTAEGGGNALAMVALIIGIVGALLGAVGIYMALQARRST